MPTVSGMQINRHYYQYSLDLIDRLNGPPVCGRIGEMSPSPRAPSVNSRAPTPHMTVTICSAVPFSSFLLLRHFNQSSRTGTKRISDNLTCPWLAYQPLKASLVLMVLCSDSDFVPRSVCITRDPARHINWPSTEGTARSAFDVKEPGLVAQSQVHRCLSTVQAAGLRLSAPVVPSCTIIRHLRHAAINLISSTRIIS